MRLEEGRGWWEGSASWTASHWLDVAIKGVTNVLYLFQTKSFEFDTFFISVGGASS